MKKLTSILLSVLLLFSLSACGQKESAPTWQEQYDLGVRYLSEGNYEEAIIAFTAAIEIDPKNADAYLGMADAYIAQGNIDAANEVLTNALVAVEDTTVIQARLDELAKQKETKVDSEPEVQPEVVLEPEPQPQPEPEPEPKPQPEPEPQPEPTPEPQPQPESESESEAYVEPAFVTWQAQMEQLAQREDAEQVSRVDISGDDITDISALSKLKNLTDISLSYTMVSDISALSGLTNVTRLYLAYNNISDISALRGLTNLRNLNLSGNSVSDISALSKLTNLTTLMLVNNNISDISALGGLTSLTTLWLSGNDLTQQQVDELQAKLPNCEIVFQP